MLLETMLECSSGAGTHQGSAQYETWIQPFYSKDQECLVVCIGHTRQLLRLQRAYLIYQYRFSDSCSCRWPPKERRKISSNWSSSYCFLQTTEWYTSADILTQIFTLRQHLKPGHRVVWICSEEVSMLSHKNIGSAATCNRQQHTRRW